MGFGVDFWGLNWEIVVRGINRVKLRGRFMLYRVNFGGGYFKMIGKVFESFRARG